MEHPSMGRILLLEWTNKKWDNLVGSEMNSSSIRWFEKRWHRCRTNNNMARPRANILTNEEWLIFGDASCTFVAHWTVGCTFNAREMMMTVLPSRVSTLDHNSQSYISRFRISSRFRHENFFTSSRQVSDKDEFPSRKQQRDWIMDSVKQRPFANVHIQTMLPIPDSKVVLADLYRQMLPILIWVERFFASNVADLKRQMLSRS